MQFDIFLYIVEIAGKIYPNVLFGFICILRDLAYYIFNYNYKCKY